jgi:hypothetical protein
MYAGVGRPSIAPEKLLRAPLLQMLYSIRSERLLMEEMDYNQRRLQLGPYATSGHASDVGEGQNVVRRARKRMFGYQRIQRNLFFRHKIGMSGENLSRAVHFSAAC